MPTISLTVDNATAAKITAAFEKYYNASNGYVDGNGDALTGAALIKEVYKRHTRQVVRRAKLDDDQATSQQAADAEADGLVIT